MVLVSRTSRQGSRVTNVREVCFTPMNGHHPAAVAQPDFIHRKERLYQITWLRRGQEHRRLTLVVCRRSLDCPSHGAGYKHMP